VSQQKTKVSKKEDLVLFAKHLKIDFKVSMRKQTIKNLVIDKLVDTNIFGEVKIYYVTRKVFYNNIQDNTIQLSC
jgi:isochorismate hydrolase